MTSQKSLDKKIEKILEGFRPSLWSHAGDLEFISFKDGVVLIKLIGSCSDCGLSYLTFNLGIEKELKKQIPEVKKLEIC